LTLITELNSLLLLSSKTTFYPAAPSVSSGDLLCRPRKLNDTENRAKEKEPQTQMSARTDGSASPARVLNKTGREEGKGKGVYATKNDNYTAQANNLPKISQAYRRALPPFAFGVLFAAAVVFGFATAASVVFAFAIAVSAAGADAAGAEAAPLAPLAVTVK